MNLKLCVWKLIFQYLIVHFYLDFDLKSDITALMVVFHAYE